MFQTSVLASGSKGNSILVRTDSTKILIDAGLSGKKICEQIQKLKLEEKKLEAIVISHEHSDHIRGAGILSRKLKIPLYISQKTYMISRYQLGKLPVEPIFFENGNSFFIGDISIQTFASSHDVVDGSNFVISTPAYPENKLGIATDLGYSSRLMLQKFQKLSTVILESNHDEKLLLNGPYPWHLKQRIKSREGHLSNNQAIAVISKIIHPKLNNIILAHLSEENNEPSIAFLGMKKYLQMMNHESNLIVANQYKSTPMINI